MPFKYNPFTHKFDIVDTSGGPAGFLKSLTGNVGGAVMGDGAGNINVVGSGPVLVTGNPGTNTLTISLSSAGFTWNVVTAATNPNSLVAENGYIPKGGASVVFALPAAAAIGDTFIIAGYGNLWSVAQNAGQSITFGLVTTTVGIGGSISATQVRDTVEIVCVTANTEFQVIDGIGNITFV